MDAKQKARQLFAHKRQDTGFHTQIKYPLELQCNGFVDAESTIIRAHQTLSKSSTVFGMPIPNAECRVVPASIP